MRDGAAAAGVDTHTLAVIQASGLVAILLLAADRMRLRLERVHVAAVVLLQGHCLRLQSCAGPKNCDRPMFDNVVG